MPDGTLYPRAAQTVFVPEKQRTATDFRRTALPGQADDRRYRPVALTALASLAEAGPTAGSAGAAVDEAVAVLSGAVARAAGGHPEDAPPAPGSARAQAAPSPAVPSAEALEQARSLGWAEGRAEALAEARAELAGARRELEVAGRALTQAIAALADPSSAVVEALAGRLEEAVTRLAAQRAGQAIDAAPAPFAARIARLAARVAQHQGTVRVHLHPDDLAAIAPLVAAGLPDLADLVTARLVPDATLLRGDADLRAPGIRLADLWDSAEDSA